MSVSAIASGVNPSTVTPQATGVQRRADFRALASALQSGDVEGAHRAFATLLSDLQQAGGHHQYYGAPSVPGSRPDATTASIGVTGRPAGSTIDIRA